MTSLCFYKGTFKLKIMNISENNIIEKAEEYQNIRKGYYERISTAVGGNINISAANSAWLLKKVAELELRIKTLEDESATNKT